MNVIFDWTLSVGNLLTILVLGAGGVGFVYSTRNRLDTLSSKMLELETQLKRMVDVLVVQGQHQERMNAIDGRLQVQRQEFIELASRFNAYLDGKFKRE